MTVERYKSFRKAAEDVGLLFMLLERLFFFLKFISLRDVRAIVARKTTGLHNPKLAPFRKDLYYIIYVVCIGVVLPVVFAMDVDLLHEDIIAIIGIYLIVFIVQHHINVVLFDQFRNDRLMLLSEGGKIWRSLRLELLFERIFPIDPRVYNGDRKDVYSLSSGKRRLIIAALDYWLIFVAYSFVYWSAIPNQFSICLVEYLDALYFSVVMGTTLGFGEITPTSPCSKCLTIVQTLNCVLFAILIVANTLNLLKRPEMMED